MKTAVPSIGIIGAGQLGRMLALAGWELGIRCKFLDPAAAPPANGLGPIIQAAFDDTTALSALARDTTLLTYEFENLSADALAHLSATTTLLPPTAALAIAQSRTQEKTFFENLGFAVAPWQAVDSQQSLEAAAASLGLPAIAKLDRLGYDGKGQRRLHRDADLEGCFEHLGSRPLVLEGWVAFDRELSIIGARDREGDIVCYPLAENQHRDGILYQTQLAAADDALQRKAEDLFRTVAEALCYVGTLAIELFAIGNELVINEMAPRVHNSGHWTIEGALTSQFENHLRAICGLPLGATNALGAVGMRNFVGALPPAATALAIEGLHFHDYGKEPRPGRKLGHATVLAADNGSLERRLAALEQVAPWEAA